MKGDKNAGPRFIRKIEDFSCSHCGAITKGNGYTDHCPICLWSMHVDINPGDRANECHGMMKPVFAISDRRGTYMVTYKCTKCGKIKKVKASPNDNAEILNMLQALK
ncbi:MAG: RNHCP domain-containing protein [Candidatus Marsarchaeota archaeon]|nr:RNHCP domain-containing protein [Candidatus Marsarchaeota archaeon]